MLAQPYPLIQAETKRIHQRRVHGRSAKMARRGKACVYTYWKTLGRRIGRLSKNTRRPFEKPPRHNLLFPFPPLLPQSSRRYTIVRAIWIKARRVDAYLLGIPILQLSVSRSPCSPNARPSLPTIVGRTCVCVLDATSGACVPDANACAPAKARAGRKHRVDTRERARGLMDDRFCVWRERGG